MSLATWQETLITSQIDGAALTASTTPTSLLPAQARYTFPGGFFNQVGRAIRITAWGRISTVVTTPGTLTLDWRLGATAVISSGAMALNIVAKTTVPWFYQVVGTVRAVGTTANFMPGGFWLSTASILVPAANTGPGPGGHILPYNATPVVGSNFDSTTSLAADFFGTWSLNNANSITVHQYMLEALN